MLWQSIQKRKSAKNKNGGRKTLHFRRTSGQLKRTTPSIGLGSTNTAPITVRAFLHELTPTDLLFFSTERIPAGESVAISLDGPKKFFVKGRVMLCMEVPSETSIVTSPKYSYRVRMEFQFASEEERLEVQNYAHELNGGPQQEAAKEVSAPAATSPEAPAALAETPSAPSAAESLAGELGLPPTEVASAA
jgi:hypothetical protein